MRSTLEHNVDCSFGSFRRNHLFLLLIGVVLACHAPDASAAAVVDYRVTRWTSENGLPQNWARALLQTRDGYLWIGTLNGLVRFDGLRFTVFDKSNAPEMVSDAIESLAEDQNDRSLWIGTREALLRYHDHHFHRCQNEQGVPFGAGGILSSAVGGGVWFVPRLGTIGLIKGDRVTSYRYAEEHVQNRISQLEQISPTELLFTLPDGLFLYNLEKKTKIRMGPPDQHPSCNGFAREPDGSIWLATIYDIWKFNSGNWSAVMDHSGKVQLSIERICRTSGGTLWCALKEQGLHRVEGPNLVRFSPPELPPDLGIATLLEDREGNLWVGTELGLVRLEPRRLRVISKRDGLLSDSVINVSYGLDHTIWIGTQNEVSAWRDGKVVNFPIATANQRPTRLAVMLSDSQNRLWTGHSVSDVLMLEKGKWRESRDYKNLRQHGSLTALYEDREGRFWLGVERGVLCDDHGKRTFYSTKNGLSHSNVRVIHEDREGDIWLGTYGGGLNRLHDGNITSYITTRGEYNNRAWWIHEDTNGVFWVASQDGLNRFKNGQFFTFTTRHGLRENVVNNVQEDNFGFLWLSGLRGIYRLPRQQLNEVADGRRDEVQCVAFGEADGMLSSECNGGDFQPSGCKDQEGRLWFPTTRGIVMIDPGTIRFNEVPPPVVIERISADDKIIFGEGAEWAAKTEPGPRNTELQIRPGGARVLDIRYTAGSFTAPERVRFRYRLDGYDRGWRRDDDNERAALYTDLHPGNYSFQVKACNSHGVWNDAGAQLAFYVAPHFYETWPFYGACVFAVGALAYGLHAFRVGQHRRFDRLQHQLAFERERARIAQDMHDDLGASLTEIAIASEVVQLHLGNSKEAELRLGRISATARTLVSQIGELVWALKPQHDTLDSMLGYLREYAARRFDGAAVECRLHFPVHVPPVRLTAEFRRNVFLVAKEALNNVANHAEASWIELFVEVRDARLYLSCADNGRGFAPESVSEFRNGLRNMGNRVAALGGEFDVRSETGKGTTMSISVVLPPATRE